MDKLAILKAAHKGARAVSFVMLFKSIVGFSVAMLALVGVTVQLLGYQPTHIAEGSAAVGGALIGAILALRS